MLPEKSAGADSHTESGTTVLMQRGHTHIQVSSDSSSGFRSRQVRVVAKLGHRAVLVHISVLGLLLSITEMRHNMLYVYA